MNRIVIICVTSITLCIICITIFHIKINMTRISQQQYQCNSNQRHKLVTFYSDSYKANLDTMVKSLQNSMDVDVVHVPSETIKSCINKYHGKHKWNGCALKLELLYDKIIENKGRYILFTDCDCVFLKDPTCLLTHYVQNDYDIVMPYDCLYGNTYMCLIHTRFNIGVIFIKCTQQLLDLVERSIDEVKSGEWDQNVLTKNLLDSNVKVGIFPIHLVSTDRVYDPNTSVIVKVIDQKDPKLSKLDAQLSITGEKIFSKYLV